MNQNEMVIETGTFGYGAYSGKSDWLWYKERLEFNELFRPKGREF